MRYLLLSVAFVLPLSASVYYAKVEPVEKYTIKSTVSGEVKTLYKQAEGKVSNGGIYIQIDDFLNKEELKSSKQKLQALKATLELTQKNLENSKEVQRIREDNYNRIKDLKTKSRVEKDNELITLISAQNQTISLENSVQNLLIQLSDLEYKITNLEDTIEDKSVEIKKGYLIYNTYINVGDYVSVGTSLVDAYDISKGKLTLYLSKEDVELAKNGVIYINDKPTEYKVDKVWDVADTQNISAYKTEILLPAPSRFSELMKVEFK
jgi:multidrug efflux pump subunit AcrA (membrane-fusion protein)